MMPSHHISSRSPVPRTEEYRIRRSYQKAGFATYPTPPGKKHGYDRWAEESTTDPAILARFRPGDGTMAHMGLSNMFCIDPDRHTEGIDGVANFKALAKEHDLKLPKTLVHDTPNDGRHIFYLQNPDCPVPTSHSRLAPGVDILAGRSLVMLMPGYPIRIQHTIAVVPVETARFIVSRTTTDPQPRRTDGAGGVVRHSISGLMTTLANAPVGERNATMYWVLNRVAEMPGKLQPRIINQLSREARFIGLGDWEISQTVDSVFGARRG